MKKLLYLTLATALMGTVSSCKNEEADIFDDTAANRLEQFKKTYGNAFCSDGGKWAFEYFANTTEPGYVFVATFSPDYSVKISANNKWVPEDIAEGTFGSDESHWGMIGDDGPVLTFNSYNKVFHTFSSPDNIVGGPSYQGSSGTDEDVDETGRGHEGDYEFVVMGVSDDGKTVTLQGKKRGYKAYLRHLDENVDDKEYLAKVYDNAHTRVTNEFGHLILHEESTDQRFTLTETSEKWVGGHAGYFEAYPQGGDSVMQTVDINAIITADGLHFRHEFSIPRADANADPLKVFDFKFQDNGSMRGVSTPDVVLRAPMLSDIVRNHSVEVGKQHVWNFENVELGNASPLLQTVCDKLDAQYNGKVTFGGFSLSAANVSNVPTAMFNIKFGSSYGGLCLKMTRIDDNTIKVETTDEMYKSLAQLVKLVPEAEDLLRSFAGTYKLSSEDLLRPTTMHWEGDNGISFDAILAK